MARATRPHRLLAGLIAGALLGASGCDVPTVSDDGAKRSDEPLVTQPKDDPSAASVSNHIDELDPQMMKDVQKQLAAAAKAFDETQRTGAAQAKKLDDVTKLGKKLTEGQPDRLVWLEIMRSIHTSLEGTQASIGAIESQHHEDLGPWFDGLSEEARQGLPKGQDRAAAKGPGWVFQLTVSCDDDKGDGVPRPIQQVVEGLSKPGLDFSHAVLDKVDMNDGKATATLEFLFKTPASK